MRKARIFVIEDSQDTELLLRIYLKKSFNCDLTFARSGADAIEILKHKSDFDVIVCDFMMSPGTGLDVLKFINESGLTVPFILYTGHAKELRSQKLDACVAVIDKLKIDDLTKIIGDLIGAERS